MSNPRVVPIYKTCPVCDREFPVCPPGRKSRIYPLNSQEFCTKDCAYKARYRHGSEAVTLTPTQAAYIAGFLDGEGSILLYTRRDAIALRVTFANTHRGVLEFLQSTIGAGSVVAKFNYNKSSNKDGFAFQVNADLALSLLRQVVDYLVIKKEQALLAIDFQTKLQDPKLKADRTWQHAVREQMQAMNKRGPIHLTKL